MKVRDFEKAVWELERIRIVVRAGEDEQVKKYDYDKAASKTFSLRELVDGRITKSVGDKKVVAINGYGKVVVGNTKLRTIKESYR